MAVMAQKPAPKAPSARALTASAQKEFNTLKHELSAIHSWNVSPNTWDKMQIIYVEKGNDAQAKTLYGAIEVTAPFA